MARVLLANGIGYKEFDSACRRAFVESASTDFGVRGRATNTARIAAMTGIPRKKVMELRKTPVVTTLESRDVLSPLTDLMHKWATAEKFRNARGRPLELALRGKGPGTFSELVRVSMGDLPPGAVRTELLRLGVAETTDSGTIRLVRRSLIPEDSVARLEVALTYSVAGLIRTIARNTDPKLQDEDRFFQRYVESRPLSTSEIQRVRRSLHARLVEVSEELDSTLNTGEAEEGVGRRVGVGIFYSE